MTEIVMEVILRNIPDRVNFSEHECSKLKKINCFRLTIDTLSITDDGWKKISQATDHKNKRGRPNQVLFV